MRHRDFHALIVDVRRLRLVVAIALAIAVLLPSIDEMVTEGLSPVVVLLRFVEALVVVGALVWGASAIVLRYARTQIVSQAIRDQEE